MSKKFERKSRYDHGCKETQKMNNINYGEFSLRMSHDSQETVLVKEFEINSSTNADVLFQTFITRTLIVHPNLMEFKDFSCSEEASWCSTQITFRCYYQFHDQTLVTLKEMVQDPSREFSERLMTKFLYDMVH